MARNHSSNYRNQFLKLSITHLPPQLSLLLFSVRSLIRNVNRLDLFSGGKESVGQVKKKILTHTVFNLRYFHLILFPVALGATPARSNIKAQLK